MGLARMIHLLFVLTIGKYKVRCRYVMEMRRLMLDAPCNALHLHKSTFENAREVAKFESSLACPVFTEN